MEIRPVQSFVVRRAAEIGILIVLLGIVSRPVQAERHFGAVYVLSNESTGNSVIAYRRASDGTLTMSGSFSTGGEGTTATGADPLGSQGALVLGEGHRLLLAVNAGSNEISVFTVRHAGLSLVDKVPSGGTTPVSIAVHESLVYVLNAGGTPNITGFVINPFTHDLVPLSGSQRSLAGGSAASPAEVSFDRDGSVLMVTEKGTQKIDTYTVNDNGYASGPTAHASSGATPFGFAFTGRGDAIVSEAGPNALSSYELDEDGNLELVTGSLADGGSATCWAVVTDDGRYAYAANAGSGTISSYEVSRHGALSLLNTAAGTTASGSAPTDMALSTDSRFLYVREGGSSSVGSFRVEDDGSLTFVGTVGGIPADTQGIAAF